MSKHTHIYLVRHGETLWNFEKRFQGVADIPLNEKGIAQAEATGAWFAANQSQFDAIYASPLIRAAQTADIIGRQINHTASPAPLLKEINCGECNTIANYAAKVSC